MTLFFKPLQPLFQKLEESDVDKISRYFEPLFHLLALGWSHSKYFRVPARFVLLLQEISNQLIIQVKLCFIVLTLTG